MQSVRFGAQSMAIGLFVLAASLTAFFVFGGGAQNAVADIAADVVDECSKETQKEACYERVVAELYPEHDLRDVFEVIRALRRIDTSYQFCHVLAHGLGERVVAEDPEKWVDAIPLNPPDGMCSNGFIHGVVGGRFRSEVLDDATIDSLIPEFSRACEARPSWQPSDLDKAICYHGLGHLYDYITDADLTKALDICARTTSEQFRRVCVEGVFMQIYQPLEPDDFELIKRMPSSPTRDTVRGFCASYIRPEFIGACLRESWPFFDEEVRSGTGVETFCSGQPNTAEEQKCYESATAIIGRMTLGAPEKASEACKALPGSRQHSCFVTVARAVIEEDRDAGAAAVALCERAGEGARPCLQELSSQAAFVYGADEARKDRFCDAIPVEFKDLCR